jgi:hypothetical protein
MSTTTSKHSRIALAALFIGGAAVFGTACGGDDTQDTPPVIEAGIESSAGGSSGSGGSGTGGEGTGGDNTGGSAGEDGGTGGSAGDDGGGDATTGPTCEYDGGGCKPLCAATTMEDFLNSCAPSGDQCTQFTTALPLIQAADGGLPALPQ